MKSLPRRGVEFILEAMTFPLLSAGDLAPGDRRSAGLDLAPFDFTTIRTIEHSLFEFAYARLWEEFGAKDEMERRETLAERFRLAPRMIYEMLLVRRGGEFVAVRDHTAAVVEGEPHSVVHLSHNLIAPTARRTGLAGWLRAFPVATARECLAANNQPANTRVTLVAEMEYPAAEDPARSIRLQAYEKAGFSKIDSALLDYHQPDFRPPDIIDASGGARPLPFQLVVRRVGLENEREISGAEIRQLVATLYAIYRPQFRAADFAHPRLSLDNLPAANDVVSLLPPTAC